ncbi:hypothetical protein ABZT03_02840 [Streptomyces sp. NPDC005574]|uniref:hypothetical protein n=1 Tax=Streptomyces sp. NPDC005574 TaxID=3156891 RepID=UPI0033A714DF
MEGPERAGNEVGGTDVGTTEADGTEEAEGAGAAGPPRGRPRGRTTLMIAAAAALGVVAGACTGYLVQADRPPTALPSLSQPGIEQAEGDVEPLSAAQDRRVRTDGDLRKLLITRPKGAKDTSFAVGSDGWSGLAGYAREYKRTSTTFNNLVDGEFRRAAVTSWQVGETYSVEIELVQFRQESKPAASEWAESGRFWAEKQENTRGWHVPGTGSENGKAYVHDTPGQRSGYLPLYAAEAHAWRGDVYVEIWIHDSKPISKAKIMDLARRQVGKL